MAHAIKMVPLDELVPHPDNPKAHDVDLIRDSIRRFGFGSPVLVCDRTGYLAAGHGRRSALLAERGNGNPAPSGVRVQKDVWLVPVVTGWSSADDEELLAYLLADNQTSASGGWDDRGLLSILSRIELSPGLAGVGFGKADLDRLMAKVNPPAPGEFPAIDPDSLHTDYGCPKCGYEWSGSPKPGASESAGGGGGGDGD